MARTVRIKLYKFNELSKASKQKAIEDWRTIETYDYVYDEAWESLKKFCEIFGIDMDSYDFLEPYRSKYSFTQDDAILELSGQRLATYIWNNFKNEIYQGKYYNSWSSKNPVRHKNVTSKLKKDTWPKDQQGEYWNVYRSSVMIESSCPFTGVCYDDDLLDPILKFMQRPTNNDFKDLMEDCLSSLTKSVEGEIRGRNEDDEIAEHLQANEYEFEKNGSRY